MSEVKKSKENQERKKYQEKQRSGPLSVMNEYLVHHSNCQVVPLQEQTRH
jgi:hypothetical protein